MVDDERDDFRLPKNVRPIEYSIRIIPDLENFTFQGNVGILIEVREDTSRIVLNAADLEVFSAQLYSANGIAVGPVTTDVDKDRETVTFKFNETLLRGSSHYLVLDFRGKINDSLDGFYRAKYTMLDGTEKYMATTQFEAIGARRAFPCWDEPEYKATFTLTLVVPRNHVAISNMPVEDEFLITYPGYKRAIHFQKTPPMSTYLLAFIVGDFEYIEGRTKNGTLVRVFATPGKKEQCKYALEAGIKILEWQEEYFNIPYPLPKLDMAAIPDFAFGAMENWGLVTFREEILLNDPKNSPVSVKQKAARIIAHEFAHMWFGDLVTMKWWNDLWLNESFATWHAYKTIDTLHPEWKEWEAFYGKITSAGLEMDGLKSTHPVEVPIKNPQEIGQIFDAISYNKGASLIRMLEDYLGEKTFRDGIRLYLNRHAYDNTCTEDLWAALSEVSGQDVASIMDTWTKQPGYPVVESQTYAQKRFSYIPWDSDQSWQIPITATGDASWVKINSSQTGFYRVQYSPEMLSALYPAIESRELSTLDSMGLLDDAYALQKAGVVPATQFLELAERYRDETEYAAWGNLCSGLAGVICRLANEPYYRELEHFAKSLLKKMYHTVCWETVEDELELQTLLRPLIVGNMGYYGHRGAIRTAKYKFSHFLKDKQSLDPNLRGVVCNIAAWYGTEATYEAMLDLYRRAQTQEEKSRYLHALGCFRNEKLLEQTLRFAMSPEVRSQDTVGVVAAVAGNPSGQDLAWEFIKANWQELEKRYGEGTSPMLSHLIASTISGLDTRDKKQEVEEFFATHPVPAATMALARALESIDINVAWLEKNRNAVGEWLANRP